MYSNLIMTPFPLEIPQQSINLKYSFDDCEIVKPLILDPTATDLENIMPILLCKKKIKN